MECGDAAAARVVTLQHEDAPSNDRRSTAPRVIDQLSGGAASTPQVRFASSVNRWLAHSLKCAHWQRRTNDRGTLAQCVDAHSCDSMTMDRADSTTHVASASHILSAPPRR